MAPLASTTVTWSTPPGGCCAAAATAAETQITNAAASPRITDAMCAPRSAVLSAPGFKPPRVHFPVDPDPIERGLFNRLGADRTADPKRHAKAVYLPVVRKEHTMLDRGSSRRGARSAHRRRR